MDELHEMVEGEDSLRRVDDLIARNKPDFSDHAWAARIAFKHFAHGLIRLTEPVVTERRYRQFVADADPVYSALLQGLADDALASTFVSYWKIAHTLATQSRFWLEDAIANIVEKDPRREGAKPRVYTARMLAAGLYERGLTLADLGEKEREELLSNRQPWRVLLQRNALRTIDQIVGDEERTDQRALRKGWASEEAIDQDVRQLRHVERSLRGPPPDQVTLYCNLVIVEPDRLDGKPHTWAFRFVNPRTLGSHAARKQERVNLLRLYAYFAQEKPLRDPRLFEVAVAEITPRFRQISGPTYFSSKTCWGAEEFWRFLDVPFDAVRVGITAAGLLLGERLRAGLWDLLPSEAPSSSADPE